MTSQVKASPNYVSTMKNLLSSTTTRRRFCTISKKTMALYCVIILIARFSNANGVKSNGKCPSVCTCNKRNVVFCNNEKLNITPIGFSSSVAELYLFNNNISSILPATLKPLKNLKILDISGNRLSDTAVWHGIFEKLNVLENLMLQDNRITRINRGMFVGLRNLARIYLFNNQIEVIESGAFDTLPNLIELKLRNNRITRFPRLNRTPNLLLLDLSSNRLTTLRDMVFSTVNVEQLMLQNNRLTELRTSVFDDTSRLTQLDISNNRLTAVPQIIKSLTNLKTLNISRNIMDAKTIPQDTFTNLNLLKNLYLRGMGLQTLPPTLIPTRTILNQLDLRENNWDCKCDMHWLPNYTRTFMAAIVSPNDVVCSVTSKHHGKKIMNLHESDFECTREELKNFRSSETTAYSPSTPPSGGKNFINPCVVFNCANGGVCHIENNRPKCRCTKDWAGTLCHESVTTTTSTEAPHTTTTPMESLMPNRPKLMIRPNSITEETVEIFLPRTNKEMLLSISEIGLNGPPDESTITPKANLYTVRNLDPGRSYNICIHIPLAGSRSTRRTSSTRRDTLCGSVKTKGVKVSNTLYSKPQITVVPSPKVTTKASETPIQKETSIMTKKTDSFYSDQAVDEKLRGNKITPQTEPTDTNKFSMLYPAVGAGIGAVIVIIIVIMFCICRRQKRLLKLKKGTNADYTPGSPTDNHQDVEMATIVHHHHHNHYNAGSIEPNNSSKSSQNSPTSTIQNGERQTNNSNPKLSPSKTNNNHTVAQPKSSRSSSRSSGVSQPDTRYTSIQPHIQALNPIQKYEQSGVPNGYNIYRGHEATQEQTRQPHRQIPQRAQNILQNNDPQPILNGNNSYYEANDSHLYPVSPLGSPTYNIPLAGSLNYNPVGHNTHALFQPIQSPLATPGDPVAGMNHRLTGSHALPPPMACLTRNLVVDNMPRYHDGVQVV